MTDDEKLEILTTLTGETDESVLSAYLTLAKGKMLSHLYPYGDGTETLPELYDSILIEVTVYLLNKRGAEGETRHTENGVDRSYDTSDIPPYLLRRIVPQAGVV